LATAERERERERERFAPLEETTKTADGEFDEIGGGVVKLGEILDYEQPTDYIVESEQYDDKYKTPVLTAGKTFILGYTNETKGIKTDLPVIIFDDFTTEIKYVDFPFKVKSSAMKILKLKNNNKAILKYVFYQMKKINFNAETNKRYWISEYCNLTIPLPDLSTQQEIVNQIEQEEKIIEENKKLIEIMDNKMQKRIDNLLNRL